MFNSFHLQAVEAFKKSEYVQAKTLFLQAISKNPEVPETYFFLGKTCFLSDEKEEAIFYLNQFIEITRNVTTQENRSHAFDLLGQCYAANNKNEEAVTYYFAAIENDLSCVSARHNLGLSYMRLAQDYLESHLENCFTLLKNAHIALSSALELCADNPMLLHTAASWHEQYIDLLKKLSKDKRIQEDISVNFMCSIHYYREALAHCKKDDLMLKNIITENLTECYAQFGHHLYQNEEYNKAQELYVLVLEGDQNHIPALNQIGMCAFKQGMYQEARKKFTTILERTSDAQDQADAWLNIACCYRLEKNWDQAGQSLSEARKLAPQDSSINEEAEKLKLAQSQELLTATNQVFFGLKPDSYSFFPSQKAENWRLN
ncbi:tetratricopeptide repeat protein [Legionella resiliens]|uniref:Tetratricopeptide repeat protein n=2 Tax=Legionella TaxID=445 RepID=A0ABS8X1H5_9GAMM|nr:MULTISPECIES: tetratricopeptide repeat protein [unclassified Legionella]MCE0723431.1 tetratricopeptide repeat protein [Legionella sp. 9fVS26]MCE3532585.1 tetratricopeptide repeat protein [Legionella sp. 8cVS16]